MSPAATSGKSTKSPQGRAEGLDSQTERPELSRLFL